MTGHDRPEEARTGNSRAVFLFGYHGVDLAAQVSLAEIQQAATANGWRFTRPRRRPS